MGKLKLCISRKGKIYARWACSSVEENKQPVSEPNKLERPKVGYYDHNKVYHED